MRSSGLLRACFLAGVSAAMFSGSAHAKTAKECEAEYQANKAEIQAKKELKRDFITKCRAEGEGATSTTPSTTTTVPNPMAPNNPNTPPATPTPPRQAAKPAPTPPPPSAGVAGKSQYVSEAEAKGHCPSDTVVWANLNSHIYHFAGHADYGHTKRGAYMCESETATAGFRAAKNEKHP